MSKERLHSIVDMSMEKISCACGWSFVLVNRREWGSRSGQDHLLDVHDLHAAAMAARGE